MARQARTPLLVCVVSGGFVLPAFGQDLGPALTVRPKPNSFERCVDVSIGQENAYGCINQHLRQEVDKVAPPIANAPPIDAKSQDLKVGVVNIPAVRQQYGRNFGVSARPYRPPAPVYTSPLTRR